MKDIIYNYATRIGFKRRDGMGFMACIKESVLYYSLLDSASSYKNVRVHLIKNNNHIVGT